MWHLGYFAAFIFMQEEKGQVIKLGSSNLRASEQILTQNGNSSWSIGRKKNLLKALLLITSARRQCNQELMVRNHFYLFSESKNCTLLKSREYPSKISLFFNFFLLFQLIYFLSLFFFSFKNKQILYLSPGHFLSKVPERLSKMVFLHSVYQNKLRSILRCLTFLTQVIWPLVWFSNFPGHGSNVPPGLTFT